jgi:hypothetical protein
VKAKKSTKLKLLAPENFMSENQNPEKQWLTPAELSFRWSISQGTLQNWRVKGIGPSFYKLGNLGQGTVVRYKAEDVLAFESERFMRVQTQMKAS